MPAGSKWPSFSESIKVGSSRPAPRTQPPLSSRGNRTGRGASARTSGGSTPSLSGLWSPCLM
jgi:hypothetical protein